MWHQLWRNIVSCFVNMLPLETASYVLGTGGIREIIMHVLPLLLVLVTLFINNYLSSSPTEEVLKLVDIVSTAQITTPEFDLVGLHSEMFNAMYDLLKIRLRTQFTLKEQFEGENLVAGNVKHRESAIVAKMVRLNSALQMAQSQRTLANHQLKKMEEDVLDWQDKMGEFLETLETLKCSKELMKQRISEDSNIHESLLKQNKKLQEEVLELNKARFEEEEKRLETQDCLKRMKEQSLQTSKSLLEETKRSMNMLEVNKELQDNLLKQRNEIEMLKKKVLALCHKMSTVDVQDMKSFNGSFSCASTILEKNDSARRGDSNLPGW